MTISSKLRNHICCDQTATDYTHYNAQANHTFLPKDGWADFKVITVRDIVDSHGNKDDSKPGPEQVLLTKLGEETFSCRLVTVEDLDSVVRYQDADKFFFLRQRNSRSRLDISRALFEHLCHVCNISPKIRSYVVCFGIRKSDVFPHPPALHYDTLSTSQAFAKGLHISGFELMYILRFVERNQQTKETNFIPWSLRQSGVCHKFDALSEEDIWLFTALTSRMEQSLTPYFSDSIGAKQRDPFELHYMLVDTSLASWGSCIDDLASEIQRQSDVVFLAEISGPEISTTRLEERQMLKRIEDFVSDLQLALSFALDDVKSLAHHHRELVHSQRRASADLESVDLEPNEQDAEILNLGLTQHQQSIERYQAQLSALRQKVQTASSLLSNILDLSNSEALKLLAIETKADNARTALLTQKAVQDGATVKVLTIITLIYLPLTVVTNFFSTSFIGTSTASKGVSHLTVTSDVWILFVIGVPLTIITIYVWWVFSQKEINGKFPTHIATLPDHLATTLGRRKKLIEGSGPGESLDI